MITSEQKRSNVCSQYAKLIGRNYYSQSLRDYCYKKYKDGNYYSDCSSSISYAYKQAGCGFGILNTASMHYNFKKVSSIKLSNGQIQNVSELRRGDMILFKGSDPSRPLQIGHVEMVYSINGNTPSQVTICGHGSGRPSYKNLKEYSQSRYNNGRGIVEVVRYIQDDSNASTPTPSRNWLQKGDSGSAVKDLQTKLNKTGYHCGDVDGVFGDKTDVAVRSLQKDNKLDVDGQAGVKTMAVLNGFYNTIIQAGLSADKEDWIKDLQKAIGAKVDGEPGSETLGKCPLLQSGSTGTVVKLVQKYMGKFCKIGVTGGYDGVFGGGTKAAVMEFQKQNRLTIDGVVGQNTWKKILGL